MIETNFIEEVTWVSLQEPWDCSKIRSENGSKFSDFWGRRLSCCNSVRGWNMRFQKMEFWLVIWSEGRVNRTRYDLFVMFVTPLRIIFSHQPRLHQSPFCFWIANCLSFCSKRWSWKSYQRCEDDILSNHFMLGFDYLWVLESSSLYIFRFQTILWSSLVFQRGRSSFWLRFWVSISFARQQSQRISLYLFQHDSMKRDDLCGNVCKVNDASMKLC